jgi:hypothetical protein
VIANRDKSLMVYGGDNKINCDITYCRNQVEKLKQQAIAAITYGTNTKISRH